MIDDRRSRTDDNQEWLGPLSESYETRSLTLPDFGLNDLDQM